MSQSLSQSAKLMLIALQSWPASDKSVKTPVSLGIPALQVKLAWSLTPYQVDPLRACAQTDWLLVLMETVKLVYQWNLHWCETWGQADPLFHSSFFSMSMSINLTFACFSGSQIGMLLRQRLCLQWGLSPRHLRWCLFSDQVWSQCPLWEPPPFSPVYLPSRIHRKSTACLQSLWVLFLPKAKKSQFFDTVSPFFCMIFPSLLSFSWFTHCSSGVCGMWIKWRLSRLHILQKQKMHQSMCCWQTLCSKR